MRAPQLERPGERLLDGDLLVEREADQERQRIGGEERSASGLPVNGRWSGGTGRLMDAWYAPSPPGARGRGLRSTDDEPRPLRRHPRPPRHPRRPPPGRRDRRDPARPRRSSSATRGSRPSRGRDDGLPTAPRSSTSAGLTVLPGLIDTHSHLVGEVQTAGVPATTTTGAQDALLSRAQRPGHAPGGLHDRPRPRSVPRLRGLRAARHDRRRRARGPADAVRRRLHHRALGRRRRRGPRARHPPARRAALRRRDARRPRSATASGGCSSAARTSSSASAPGAVLTRGGVPGVPELSEDELRAAVEEAALYGAFVAVHAHSAEGARRAIRAGARSVEHGSMLDRRRRSRCSPTPALSSASTCSTASGRSRTATWPAGRPTRCAR